MLEMQHIMRSVDAACIMLAVVKYIKKSLGCYIGIVQTAAQERKDITQMSGE